MPKGSRFTPSVVLVGLSVAALAGGGNAGSSAGATGQGLPPRPIPVNGSFERGVGGWRGVGAALVRVHGGADGKFAARGVMRGRPRVFGISRRLASAGAGTVFTAAASVRARRPGRRLCLRLREAEKLAPAASESCVPSFRRWRRVRLVHRAEGGPLNLSLSMRGAAPGDWFDVDAVVVRERVPVDPPGVGRALWRADHETGDLSQWSSGDGGGEFNSGTADTVVSTKMPHSGRYSAEMTLARSPSGTRLFRWQESAGLPAAYYGAWFYFPRRYTVDRWWNIFQFKSRSEDGARNDPFWIVNVGNRARGSMFLYLYDWKGRRSYVQRVRNLPAGQWVHVEAFLQESANGTGRLVVWQDAEKLFDVRNITTRFPDGVQHWSVNNYGDGIHPTPATIFVDDAAVSAGSPP